ncbi:MAG: gamma-glutamylcyclotransferase, partial [Halocynthiibacter sp.]
LDNLDRREIAYRRSDVWLDVRVGDFVHRRRALTYVADPDCARLCADISPQTQITLLRQGKGVKGSSLFYLQNTVQCLNDDGHFRTDAHRLFAKVKANRGGIDTP